MKSEIVIVYMSLTFLFSGTATSAAENTLSCHPQLDYSCQVMYIAILSKNVYTHSFSHMHTCTDYWV